MKIKECESEWEREREPRMAVCPAALLSPPDLRVLQTDVRLPVPEVPRDCGVAPPFNCFRSRRGCSAVIQQGAPRHAASSRRVWARSLFWFSLLVLYFGTLCWFSVLVLCSGTLCWFSVLVPGLYAGSLWWFLFWFSVLLHCPGFLSWFIPSESRIFVFFGLILLWMWWVWDILVRLSICSLWSSPKTVMSARAAVHPPHHYQVIILTEKNILLHSTKLVKLYLLALYQNINLLLCVKHHWLNRQGCRTFQH